MSTTANNNSSDSATILEQVGTQINQNQQFAMATLTTDQVEKLKGLMNDTIYPALLCKDFDFTSAKQVQIAIDYLRDMVACLNNSYIFGDFENEDD